jgi:hypothetical protein
MPVPTVHWYRVEEARPRPAAFNPESRKNVRCDGWFGQVGRFQARSQHARQPGCCRGFIEHRAGRTALEDRDPQRREATFAETRCTGDLDHAKQRDGDRPQLETRAASWSTRNRTRTSPLKTSLTQS